MIAATNFSRALDPAIWRRFDDILRFGLPDADALETLVSLRLHANRPSSEQIGRVVRTVRGSSFAEAERVCLEARKRCALAGRNNLEDTEIDAALKQYAYRRALLCRTASDSANPAIDRQ